MTNRVYGLNLVKIRAPDFWICNLCRKYRYECNGIHPGAPQKNPRITRIEFQFLLPGNITFSEQGSPGDAPGAMIPRQSGRRSMGDLGDKSEAIPFEHFVKGV